MKQSKQWGSGRETKQLLHLGLRTSTAKDFPQRPEASSSFRAGECMKLTMTPPTLLWVLMLVAMATGARSGSEENELDYGYWNYREGADHVNVATVRSVTRVLDAWGKRIFNEIKTLLHSQPSTLLPDYSRVRPLSESVNDLFREVSLLHRRITELTHRLATLDPFLRHHGYRGKGEEEGVTPLTVRGGALALSRPGTSRGTRVLRRRRVKIFNNGGVQVFKPDT